jgi:hypothetical protein
MMLTGFGMDEADAYIARVRWQFAVTMPEWPHEYTVKAWQLEWSPDFDAFCRLIAQHGFVEPWPPPPARVIYHNHYLVIGRHKYWAMGAHGDLDPPEQMTVINRALHP